MDQATIDILLAQLVGMVTGWALIIIFFRIRGKRGVRYVHSSMVSDSHLTPMFGVPISDWKSCFAWRPVRTIDEGLIWLRRYWRRRIRKKAHLDGPDWRSYQKVVLLRHNGRRLDPELWP
jgi:hypothetical protein